MTSTDREYIVASIGAKGRDIPRGSGAIKATCKTPRDAVTAFNPSLEKVSMRVPEEGCEGVTIFSTGSGGDIVVIDLALLHAARCLTQS